MREGGIRGGGNVDKIFRILPNYAKCLLAEHKDEKIMQKLCYIVFCKDFE